MILPLTLIAIAGVAEHFKDLSEEGKLRGYWDKNHEPMMLWPTWNDDPDGGGQGWVDELCPIEELHEDSRRWGEDLWWKAHWLQGGVWEYIPVWIRQYLSFRDGWHLLKFISLNGWAAGTTLIWSPYVDYTWYGYEFPAFWGVFISVRLAFSLPETILRKIRKT